MIEIIKWAPQVLTDNGLTTLELVVLLFKQKGGNYTDTLEKLRDKHYILRFRDPVTDEFDYRISRSGIALIDKILIESNLEKLPTNKLKAIASELKKIFPEGKKEGTTVYWTEGVELIVKRLELFFFKYGTNFSPKQIIEATKKYVTSFNSGYRKMKTLKYFILKDKLSVAGDIENTSDLLTYMENAGHEEELKEDWTSNIN